MGAVDFDTRVVGAFRAVGGVDAVPTCTVWELANPTVTAGAETMTIADGDYSQIGTATVVFNEMTSSEKVMEGGDVGDILCNCTVNEEDGLLLSNGLVLVDPDKRAWMVLGPPMHRRLIGFWAFKVKLVGNPSPSVVVDL